MFRKIKGRIKLLAQLTLATIAATPIALAQTTGNGIDLSGIVNLVMSLLPLFIVLIIIRALMNAFSNLAD